ncbi:MAG TPA: hypothetical protein VKQ05_10935 [Gemmatimonadales bacterium]|nr:hypothetical protein [Gemmatimonadales bacterium]
MHACAAARQAAPHVGTDRIVEIDVVIGQYVLDVDGIETRHPDFVDYDNEVEARFLNQHAEVVVASDLSGGWRLSFSMTRGSYSWRATVFRV